MAYAIYEDFPLAKNEIRLIRILPAKSPDDPLVCEPVVANLGCVPDYVCLSYTWGGNKLDHTVTFSQSRFPVPVTSSCFDALSNLRRIGIRTVWIDQLSINQANNSERNHQVQMMRWIYQEAQTVYVWLSLRMAPAILPLSLRTETLSWLNQSPLPLKSKIARAFGRSPKIPERPKISIVIENKLLRAATLAACVVALCNQEHDATSMQIQTLKNDDGWRALASVLQRPYFARRWVIQEIIASQSVTVLSEDHACSLDIFIECLAVMKSGQAWKRTPKLPRLLEDFRRYVDYTPMSALGYNLPIVKQIRDVLAASGEVPLMWLLHVCDGTQVSQFHDAVYAVASMTSTHGSLPPPRYDLSLDEVLLEYAQYIVEQGYGVAMIEDAGISKHRSTTPSWVPNWPRGNGDSLKRRWYAAKSTVMPATDMRPSPSSGSTAFLLSPDRLRLSMVAVMLDPVVLTTVNRQNTHPLTLENRKHFASDILEQLNQYEVVSTDELQQVARRMRPVVKQFVRELFEAYQKEEKIFDFQTSLVVYLSVIYMFKYLPAPGIKAIDELSSDISDALSFLGTRSSKLLPMEGYEVCFTERGHIGLVPDTSRRGDRVIFCKGMWNSMLVRYVEGSYPGAWIVVGDAFFLPWEEVLGTSSPDLVPTWITLV